ncbi:hypothetical protein ACWDTT_31470 [Streptosporangium sandarakinum]
MDAYSSGTGLYTTSLAMCVASAAIPNSPMFSYACRMAAAAIGVLYSSPSDIKGCGDGWKGLNPHIEKTKTAIQDAAKSVSDEEWKKMGREEFDAAYKQFCDELDKCKGMNDAVGGCMDGAAKMSFAGALVSTTGSGILFGFAMAALAGKLVPGIGQAASLAIQSAGITYANVFQTGLKNMATKNLKVLAAAAMIAAMAGQFFSQSTQQKLATATTPANGDMPAFEQVMIEGLPVSTKGLPGASGMPTAPSTPGG